MHRYFVVPPRALQPYIDRLWGWESAAAPVLPRLLPGTGAELMFHYRMPLAIDGPPGLRCPGPASLLCVRSAPSQPIAAGPVGFISVRFRSGALRHFCPLPLAALRDEVIAAGDIWGAEGRAIAEQVALAAGHTERLALLLDWLAACLQRHGKRQPALEHAVRALYYSHRTVRIDALADSLGLSRRQLERLFCQHIGLTPKRFQRTARFHLTVRDLLLGAPPDTLVTALDHGFYDQAHFIHDFEHFVGEPPLRFLQGMAPMAHFYNPPLFSPDKVPLPR